MFTQKQIDDIHDRLGNENTLPEYLRALSDIGVEAYDSFISDGHSEYFGKDGQVVVSPPAHEVLDIATTSNREKFLQELELSSEGKSSYLEMSKGLAASGIEKWTFDTSAMTMSYFDINGVAMLIEAIE